MTDTILLVHPHPTRRRQLGALLQRHGFDFREADSIATAETLFTPLPALLLLDVDPAHPLRSAAWDDFGRRCRAAGLPCLAFSASGLPVERINELAPWRTAALRDIDDQIELLLTVSKELTVRRLTEEFNLSHQLLLDKQAELERHLQSAAQIQKALIPSSFPTVEKLRFAWRFAPCRKVGGDLFNVQQLDEETLMAYMLDVTGHGISSAMVTVSVYQSLSHHTGRIVKRVLVAPPYYKLLSPAEVLEELDREYPFERFESYFTICYLLLNPDTGRLRYCSGGHPPPLLLRADGSLVALRQGGTIIGMDGLVPFVEGEILLRPGDRLFLYTDGLSERTDSAGLLLGEERLVELLQQGRNLSLDDLCTHIVDAVHAFGDGRPMEDDLTLLGIEYLPGG